ncbi:MAG TPA: S1C family serine protease [Polyangia bacterium]|nr:S1C family serine protease [Polyangia bacterium]
MRSFVVVLALAAPLGGQRLAAAAALPSSPPGGTPASAPLASPAARSSSSQPFCAGAYADDFGALQSTARDFDRHPEATFSYCTRNTAIYECLSYGPDGAVRRERKRAVLHGTAFAYRQQGGDTLLLTNDHVASWPTVTDAQHTVDDVPAGCKLVSESLALVDDERDSYARDDVPVTMVVTDPQLDVAVLRAHAALQMMRWKVGSSAALRERNVVEVRGFPLGAFRATNVGKVVVTHDHDDEGSWNHDDFVTDALLSSGNSGSPVLAISCATGEYELVGIFHAGYTGGSALNVVVGIDQVRDLMTTLKRAPRPGDGPVALDRVARERLSATLGSPAELVFPFGGHVAVVRGRADDTLFFVLYPKDYPFSIDPLVVIEDTPAADPLVFGDLGRVWFGSARGLLAHDRSKLDGDAQSTLAGLLRALRSDALAHGAYRKLGDDSSSRQSAERARGVARSLQKVSSSRADLVQATIDLAERLSPQASERGLKLSDVVASVAEPPAVGPTLAPSVKSKVVIEAGRPSNGPETNARP